MPIKRPKPAPPKAGAPKTGPKAGTNPVSKPGPRTGTNTGTKPVNNQAHEPVTTKSQQVPIQDPSTDPIQPSHVKVHTIDPSQDRKTDGANSGQVALTPQSKGLIPLMLYFPMIKKGN